MRKSVIISSVSTIVAKAIDCLVAAAVALRTRLHHSSMRERQSNWHEQPVQEQLRGYRDPCDSSPRDGSTRPAGLGNQILSLWQASVMKRPLQALALCPAYAAIARVNPSFAAKG